jgi:hypothetical protein
MTTRTARVPLLTVLAVLMGLLAVSNFMKPLAQNDAARERRRVRVPRPPPPRPRERGHGTALRLLLATYAYGAWTRRRWVVPLSIGYAGYVVLNLVLFSLAAPPTQAPSLGFMAAYIAVAVGVSAGGAVYLYRNRAPARVISPTRQRGRWPAALSTTTIHDTPKRSVTTPKLEEKKVAHHRLLATCPTLGVATRNRRFRLGVVRAHVERQRRSPGTWAGPCVSGRRRRAPVVSPMRKARCMDLLLGAGRGSCPAWAAGQILPTCMMTSTSAPLVRRGLELDRPRRRGRPLALADTAGSFIAISFRFVRPHSALQSYGISFGSTQAVCAATARESRAIGSAAPAIAPTTRKGSAPVADGVRQRRIRCDSCDTSSPDRRRIAPAGPAPLSCRVVADRSAAGIGRSRPSSASRIERCVTGRSTSRTVPRPPRARGFRRCAWKKRRPGSSQAFWRTSTERARAG